MSHWVEKLCTLELLTHSNVICRRSLIWSSKTLQHVQCWDTLKKKNNQKLFWTNKMLMASPAELLLQNTETINVTNCPKDNEPQVPLQTVHFWIIAEVTGNKTHSVHSLDKPPTGLILVSFSTVPKSPNLSLNPLRSWSWLGPYTGWARPRR